MARRQFVLRYATSAELAILIDQVRDVMRGWFIEGSDPGLCVTLVVPDAIQAFGRRCQHEIIDEKDARVLAARLGVHLEGLGGTEQGVIGALAAVGLAATGEVGRVVQLEHGRIPTNSGPQQAAAIHDRGGGRDWQDIDSGALVATAGVVEIGKHLRPNIRGGRIVMFVASAEAGESATWRAVKLP